MIASMGPPCRPEQLWNVCEPALTVLPTFFLSGIMAICVGLAGIAWSLLRLDKRHGGPFLGVWFALPARSFLRLARSADSPAAGDAVEPR